MACLKHFEITHPGAEAIINMEGVGNHPNAWFAASMAYWREKNSKEKGAGVKREAGEGEVSENSQAAGEDSQAEATPMVEESA